MSDSVSRHKRREWRERLLAGFRGRIFDSAEGDLYPMTRDEVEAAATQLRAAIDEGPIGPRKGAERNANGT